MGYFVTCRWLSVAQLLSWVSKAHQTSNSRPSQGSLNYPFWGDQRLQMYGGFSLIVQKVWVGNLMTPVSSEINALQRICPRSSCFQTDLITGCIQRDISKEQYSTITGELQFNNHSTLKSFHHLKMYFIISWICNVWNHGNPRVPAPMPPPTRKKANDYKRY